MAWQDLLLSLKRNRLNLGILTGLVFLAYFNSLSSSFVSDDRQIIFDLPNWTLNNVFNSLHYSFRLFLYYFLFHSFGPNPFVFHLTNFIFHLLNVVLIYFLLRLITPKTAFFASALFAVHPVLTESVSWVSGGVYPQYTFFFLISFITYILAKQDKKLLWVSAFAFILSFLSSEKALPLIVVFVFYELLLGKTKEQWKNLIPNFLVSLGFIIYFVSLLGKKVTSLRVDYYQDITNLYNPLLQIPSAIGSYIQLIFWPLNLAFYHTEMNFNQVQFGFLVVLTLIFLVLIVYGLFKNRELAFWLTLVLIALSPTLTPLPIAWIVAERYLYLGALGVFVAISLFLVKLNSYQRLKPFVLPVFIAIIVILTIRTMVRNIDWKNEDNLWLATAKVAPSSHANHNNLGDYFSRHGDYENSIREFKMAIVLKPNYADAYHNLGNAYVQAGRDQEALESYGQAMKFNPNIWQTYLSIADIYFREGKFEQSLDYIQKGLQIFPNNPDFWSSLAFVYSQTGEKEKATSAINKALELDPKDQRTLGIFQQIQSK